MTDSRLSPFTRAHIIYVAIAGLVGLSGLVVAIESHPALFLGPLRQDPQAFVTFLTLAFISRLLSYRMAGMVTFSLDTGAYVASLLTLGTGPATLVVFLAMLLRGLLDLVNREVAAREPWPPIVSASKLLFGPSISALIVVCIGLCLDPATRFAETEGFASLIVLYLVTAMMLIVPQFAVVTVAYWLNRLPWRRILREVVFPGLAAEAIFLPAGFALVIVYRERDILALMFLALAYIIFSAVFRKMWLASQSAREKAEELAVVEEAGRAAASTLDIEEVGRRIGISLLQAIEGAIGVVLIARGSNEGGERTYVRARERVDKPLILNAVLRSLGSSSGLFSQEPGPPTNPMRSGGKISEIGEIIARPMVGPGGSDVGHLSLVMRFGSRASGRERRLVESIARQAAIAVENWRLYSMATVDGLTGLYIRRYLEARLKEEFERVKRSQSPFCVLMVDVDNLKEVNDEFGHAAGDTLLRKVAQAMKESVRGMDVAARWGGDEFAALLVDMDLDSGLAVAQRIAQAIRRGVFTVGLERVTPSASIGVAVFDGGFPDSPAELMAMADRALYRAKKSGERGSVVAVQKGV